MIAMDAIKRRKMVKEIMADVTTQYGAIVALCLRDKLGFGKERAQRFMGNVDDVFGAIAEGYLTVDDVVETVQEELGIRF